MRRLAGSFGAALLLVPRSWSARIAVVGHSMEPTLLDGDWLLVDPSAFARRVARVGDLVVARDPRQAGRLLVKRVQSVDSDGRLTLVGDHAAHAGDGTRIGVVTGEALVGRPWFRYWPPCRLGQIS